jgi:hypothetical protein
MSRNVNRIDRLIAESQTLLRYSKILADYSRQVIGAAHETREKATRLRAGRGPQSSNKAGFGRPADIGAASLKPR